MGRWTDGWLEKQINGWMNGYKDGQVNQLHVGGQTDGWIERWKSHWMNGYVGEHMAF